MERMLQKLAQQLNAYDEASLMSLWDRYAAVVDRFEPTKRWEEAALVLSLIQAVRWKNQLFNHHWAAAARPEGEPVGVPPRMAFNLEPVAEPAAGNGDPALDGGPADGESVQKRRKVLSFRPREGD